MTGKMLAIGILAFVPSVCVAENKPKKEIQKVVEFFRIGGSCPKAESKLEMKCLDGDSEVQKKFTIYTFNESALKKIKTTSKSCPAKLIEDTLKLPVDKANVKRLDEDSDAIDKVDFSVESCTVFTKSPYTPQLAMIVQVQKPPAKAIQGVSADIVFRKFTFAKVDTNDVPLKILKVLHSQDGGGDSVDSLKVEKLCDGTGDDQADIILKQKLYYLENYQLIRIVPETDEVFPETWQASGSCGC